MTMSTEMCCYIVSLALPNNQLDLLQFSNSALNSLHLSISIRLADRYVLYKKTESSSCST
jgi:hypothetical protein